MKKILEIQKPELVDIGLGCEMRRKAKDEILLIEKKIEQYRAEIRKLEEQIMEKAAFDNRLQEEGFCLIDKQVKTKNALTGQIMKIKFVHQDNCISLKGE